MQNISKQASKSRGPLHTVLLAAPLLIVGVASTGCKGDDGSSEDEVGETHGEHGESESGSESESETGEAEVVFWQDVAPIYFENCASCHREGGIGPFSLDNYEDAATWAGASALAVENRVMPPWLVTDDGSCGDWAHSPTLSDEQIDMIVTWAQEGVPEGTPRDDLSIPVPDTLEGDASYDTPNFMPEPQGGVLAEFDEYRCFLIDPELESDRYLTGYAVSPGNEAIVHHVLMMPVEPDIPSYSPGMTNLEVIQALDAESPDRDGWPCFGAAGDNVDISGLPVTWAPGQGVVEFPQGSGYRIAADSLYVIQIHYNMDTPESLGQSDSSKVEVAYADEVEKVGFFDLPDGLLGSLFEGQPDALPAGETAFEYTWEISVDDYIAPGKTSTSLWGFFPHMHERGVSLTARVLNAEGEEVGCLGDVPRWDFGWQLYYFLDQPLVLNEGERLEVTCTFDTSADDEPTMPGWGTRNEMCLAGIYVIP